MNTNKLNVKKYLGLIILSVILISLDIYFRQLFYTLLLAYGLFIKFLLSEFITERVRKILAGVIWTAVVVLASLTFYVNYYMPHGPMYNTGDVVCQNDDRGPCGEKYSEDLRNVNIPDWAKFLREPEGELLLFGLLFAGIVISGAKNKNL